MPDAMKRRLQDWTRRKEAKLPLGYSMTVVAATDAAMMVIGGIAALQRPLSEWPAVLIATAIAFAPDVMVLAFDVDRFRKHLPPALWASFMVATAILLFANPAPIAGDFAPLLLSLTVGTLSAITPLWGGLLVTVSAGCLLGCAAALNRLDTPALYLAFIAIGWLVGYLMHTQQQLLLAQREMQEQLAQHAVADERRRIAREVHDVIAHSLSVTLLHLTGARHSLQYDGVDDSTVRALQRAEHLGRQAMADIRRTVGLLDADTTARRPEPGVTDIATLVEDFSRAGLDVTFVVDGSVDDVSAASGLALYRIAQESLANVAKHAPGAPATISIATSRSAATLRVVNATSHAPADRVLDYGRGLRGMKQRIELLGGTIEVGPGPDGWSVRADVPIGADESECSLGSMRRGRR